MPTSTPSVSPAHYWRQERWHEPTGAFLFWPAIWYQGHQVRGLFLTERHWTLGFARWRWRLIRGEDTTPDLSGPISWQTIEGPAFLAWASQTFAGSWTSERAQGFFRDQPRWRDLVAQGHLDNHYLRILIAREMLAAPTPETTPASAADPLDRL